MQTTIEYQTGMSSSALPYVVAICIILTLISWVEDIKKFSATFLIGNLLIFGTVITVSCYCIWLVS